MTTIVSVLNRRNTVRVDIPIVGDSVTEGYAIDTFTSRYISRLNSLARNMYPVSGRGAGGGEGFITAADVNGPTWTPWWSGTVGTAADAGPIRNDVTFSSAGTWTFTAPSGTTSVKLMYLDDTTAGSFTWKVNSGSTTTITNAGSGDGKLTGPIAMGGGDTLTVTWVSGTVTLAGLVHFAGDEANGITFHGCGHYGWTTGPGGWGDSSPYDWRQSIANLAPAAAAFGIFLGLNDAETANGDETAAVFQGYLETLIANMRAKPAFASVPLLLISPYTANFTYADVGGPAAYTAAIRNAATADGNALFINLSPTMAPVASDPGYYYDIVHPNDAGHLLLAQIVAAAIAPPAAYACQMSSM